MPSPEVGYRRGAGPPRPTGRRGIRQTGGCPGATLRRARRRRGAAMATAVQTLQNFIDGAPVDPASGETAPVINPATGEKIARAPLSGPEDVDRAVSAARAAYDAGWSTTTPGERALALLRIADAIEERAEELGQLEATNAGKPLAAFRD